MPSPTLTTPAPAKLNLALAVGPRNPDGMHPVCSWMVTLDLCDELTLTRLEDDRLSRYAVLWHGEAPRRTEIDWSISRDLAVRAHLALEQHVGHSLPVQMRLTKRIPVGGGIGGGSSDAAAMLHAANDLFALNLSTENLAAIGATVGSDVPFLVHGGSALVSGLGERIEPMLAPHLAVVLVFPKLTCPTAAVYRAFDDLPGRPFRDDAVRKLASGRNGPDVESLFNDLAEPAMAVEPALEQHLRDVAAVAEGPAHLSGSGSTIFVVCDDPIHAEALAASITERLGLAARPAKIAEER